MLPRPTVGISMSPHSALMPLQLTVWRGEPLGHSQGQYMFGGGRCGSEHNPSNLAPLLWLDIQDVHVHFLL
jgi:hypothetical protein